MKKRIDRHEVTRLLDKISALAQAADYETAHNVEDELHERVLFTIANGLADTDAASLARLTLTSKRIRFPRRAS